MIDVESCRNETEFAGLASARDRSDLTQAMAFPAGDLSQGVVRQLALVSTEHQSEAFKVLTSERLRVNIADLGLGVNPFYLYVFSKAWIETSAP